MNDQDLERELRSQRSPREDGYTPARLPMNLDDGTPSGARRSMVPRAALVAVAALAGALAVAVVTGILSGPRPDVGSDGSPSAQATASVPADCGPSDVAFSAEPWGGAAGSRGTVVTVKLAAGHDACTLGKGLAAQVADANGSVLVTDRRVGPRWVRGTRGRSLVHDRDLLEQLVRGRSGCAGDPGAEDVRLGVIRAGGRPDR